MRKFENVQLENEVDFINSDNMIVTGIVSNVDDRKFSVSSVILENIEGVISIRKFKYNFLKTGTKSNSHYTYGNAIAFRKSPEQILES
jgi:hypothetical protein